MFLPWDGTGILTLREQTPGRSGAEGGPGRGPVPSLPHWLDLGNAVQRGEVVPDLHMRAVVCSRVHVLVTDLLAHDREQGAPCRLLPWRPRLRPCHKVKSADVAPTPPVPALRSRSQRQADLLAKGQPGLQMSPGWPGLHSETLS